MNYSERLIMDGEAKRFLLGSGVLGVRGAKIGSMQLVRGKDPQTLTVRDLTTANVPPESLTWVCHNPLCSGKAWPTKAALIEAHGPTKAMEERLESHCYSALADIPASEYQPPVRDDSGACIRSAVLGHPAMKSLLSDVE